MSTYPFYARYIPSYLCLMSLCLHHGPKGDLWLSSLSTSLYELFPTILISFLFIFVRMNILMDSIFFLFDFFLCILFHFLTKVAQIGFRPSQVFLSPLQIFSPTRLEVSIFDIFSSGPD
jgi:hypothetical protein